MWNLKPKIILGLFIVLPFCVKSNTTLTVVTEQWPPFNYVNQQGDIDGIATKRVKAVLDVAGNRLPN